MAGRRNPNPFLLFSAAVLLAGGVGLFQPCVLHADEGGEPGASDEASLSQEGAGQAGEAGKDYLTAEELLKTPAGEQFITRHFEEALEGFKALAQQYPQDIKIKRYSGACLFHLKRYDEAVAAFREAVALHEEDLPSRQFLAKAYIRQAELDKAETELKYIQEHDTQGSFTGFVRMQLEAIEKIRKSEAQIAESAGGSLTPQQFLKTEAARYFMRAEYEEALVEFAVLEADHPQDVTIKRYRGIALDKVRRFEDALAEFDSALQTAPDNIPLHYYRAVVLLHMQRYQDAKAEWEFVVANDRTDSYKPRAEVDLKSVERILLQLAAQKPKIWTGSFGTGIDYNTNAASESRITKATAEEHAFKFPLSFGLNYEQFRSKHWQAKLGYLHSDSFYSDTVDGLQVISHNLSETVTYTNTVNGKPFMAQLASSGAHTVVGTKLYTLSTSHNLTGIYSFVDWWRITLTGKYSFTNYKSDGTDGDRTSKTGPGFGLDWSNNFYLNQEKTRYTQLGYEFASDDLEGSNYVKESHAWKTGYYFPFPWKPEWSTSFRFKYKTTDFPEYTRPIATANTRFDGEYTAGTSLSIPLSLKGWTLTGSYNYTNVNSKDNVYTYINHAGGFSLNYNF